MKRHGGTLNAYSQIKEVILKRLYESNFLEMANYGDGKKISGCQGMDK